MRLLRSTLRKIIRESISKEASLGGYDDKCMQPSLEADLVSEASKRKPRKKGQHRQSPSHSDLYTDENPKGTIKGLKFATVKDAEKSVNKIKRSGRSHAHKIQAAVAMEQRAKVAGKKTAAGVYRSYINSVKKESVGEYLTLRLLIREQILSNMHSIPPEKEFVSGPDVLAGYIVVRDSHDRHVLAYAPITRTDGPDRPFLVRTTDTSWAVPHGIVKIIYPDVQDVFNFVDSKEDWNNLGPGDHGKVGLFEWEWVENEPVA